LTSGCGKGNGRTCRACRDINIGEGIKRSPIKDSFLCDKGKMSRKSQEENASGRYNRARKEEKQR